MRTLVSPDGAASPIEKSIDIQLSRHTLLVTFAKRIGYTINDTETRGHVYAPHSDDAVLSRHAQIHANILTIFPIAMPQKLPDGPEVDAHRRDSGLSVYAEQMVALY